jgi:hypothetical protein
MEVKTGLGRVSLLLALAGLLAMALASSAVAAPAIGKGGQISACYLVKGKAKGAMRAVPANKKCRRGERKLAWSVAAAPGAAGAQGATGPQGPAGSPGPSGTPGANGAAGTPGTAVLGLETQVASLTLQVEALENILNGVTNNDLTGVLDTLDGLTNAELLGAVGAVPVLKTVCGQVSGLVSQSNLLGGSVGSLVTTLTGTLLGPIFGAIDPPDALDPFTCTGL